MGAGWRCPQVGTDPIQVVDNLSVFDGQFTDQLLLAIQACIDHVGEAKLAGFDMATTQQQIVGRSRRLREDADDGGKRERDTAAEGPGPRAFFNHGF
jgi:hypothetical protein